VGSAQSQNTLWSSTAREWTKRIGPLGRPLWEAMLDAANVDTGTRLLDVGCGGGDASFLASRRGARVSGLDASQDMVDVARERMPEADFRTGDMSDLPYDTGAFDVVFAANCVQYAIDSDAALREFRRVCAPGGRIVAGLFSTPDKVQYSSIMKAVRSLAPMPANGDGPFSLSAPGRLEQLFEEADLNVTDAGEVDCPFAFADFDTLWRGVLAGPVAQGAYEAAGEDTLRSTVQTAAKPYRADDGSFLIRPNIFRYVLAQR
jgi:SAM-dependent methyltransferase